MNHLFCFGLGYTAKRLVTRLSAEGAWKFSGTSRSTLHFPNTEMHIFDALLLLPDDITHILISIPPKETGDLVYNRFLAQIAKLKNLKWLGFLSSTTVYGDHKGEWTTEESVVNLGNPLARYRLIAENQWLDAHKDLKIPSHILRIAGIYGPGRSALERAISGHLKIIDKSDTIFSRIHVDDIVSALILSINATNPGSTYNLSDDYPCNPRENSEFACKILGITPPNPIPLAEAELSEIGLGFYAQSKRVSNKKVKTELGLTLAYPSYKEGLIAIAKECGYIRESPF